MLRVRRARSIWLRTPPARALEAIKPVPLGEMPLVRMLTERGAEARFRGAPS